jgi:hypothetical protein
MLNDEAINFAQVTWLLMIIKEGAMIRDIKGGMVFSVENETDSIMAAIQGSGITRCYECTLSSCDNPVCTCGTVNMSFSPRGHEDRNNPITPYQVDIDVVHKQLAYKDKNKVSKENLAFAELLLSNLDDADFQFLWKLYYVHKNEKTEKAPIDSIEVDFDFQEVEQNGLMYLYRDVLPYGDPLLVRMKGKDCLIFDQYCLQPKCSCTDATLTFVSGDEESGKTGGDLFTVAVNYKKKQWSAVEAHSVPVDVEAARSAMEEQIPEIYKRLRNRHIKLKGIYAHCKKRHFKQQLQLPKVGRNDPCPCGSGKKYKKCCM